MELAGAIRGYTLQLVVIGDAVLYVLVKVAISSPYDAIPLAGDERTDVGVLAGLRRTAMQEKAGVVYFTGCLPLQERLAVAGGSGEADQGDDGVCGHGCQVEEQEKEQRRPNVQCGM